MVKTLLFAQKCLSFARCCGGSGGYTLSGTNLLLSSGSTTDISRKNFHVSLQSSVKSPLPLKMCSFGS